MFYKDERLALFIDGSNLSNNEVNSDELDEDATFAFRNLCSKLGLTILLMAGLVF